MAISKVFLFLALYDLFFFFFFLSESSIYWILEQRKKCPRRPLFYVLLFLKAACHSGPFDLSFLSNHCISFTFFLSIILMLLIYHYRQKMLLYIIMWRIKWCNSWKLLYKEVLFLNFLYQALAKQSTNIT